MNRSDFDRLERLFRECVRLSPEAQRLRLEELARESPELAAELRAMLETDQAASAEAPTDAFARGVASTVRSFENEIDAPEGRIGPYKLIDRVGEGGMGVVYRAEQIEPVRRMVALKIIKLGMDTREVIARFEAERQAVALMDHPNIARIHDAGATAQGRPYFVMELVRGEPITDYCDRNNLAIRDRLELFLQVCSAVQHAHQKGVIHRDIKPSNVLVSDHAGAPAPKIIDFGVAKAVDKQLAAHTIHTHQGQLIGTPEYMSPEQADLASHDIDTRSDIYSLGVLLYELLTGVLPYDKDDMRRMSLDEALRTIREVDPPRPSARLTALGDLSKTTLHRKTDRGSLLRDLRNDLDWVVMKTLEKSRTRRYQTPDALAEDVRRFLDGEPVEAGPPSTTYRVRKFVSRNRRAVAAVSLIFATLLVGLAATSWQAVRATQAERIAQRAAEREMIARREAEDALEETRLARVAAEEERATAIAISGFLEGILRSPSPDVARGRDLTVREVLDTAAENLEHDFTDQPHVRGALRRVIGESYWAIGEFAEAQRMLEASIADLADAKDEDRAETYSAMTALGLTLLEGGRPHDAIPTLQRGADGLASLLPSDDPTLLTALHNLGNGLAAVGRFEEAEQMMRGVVEGMREAFGADHRDVIRAAILHAQTLAQTGRHREGREQVQRALRGAERTLDDDDVLWVYAHRISGWLAQLGGLADDAERHYVESLAHSERLMGPAHPDTLWMMNQLAWFLKDRGMYAEALRLAETAHARLLETQGPDSRRTLDALNTLASVTVAYGDRDRALELHHQCLDGNRRLFGERSLGAAGALNNIANIYFRRDPPRARELYEEVLAIRSDILGEDHPETLSVRKNLATLAGGSGDSERAIALYNALIPDLARAYGESHPKVAQPRTELASALTVLGRWDDAVAEMENATPILIDAWGEDSNDARLAMLVYGVALRGAGRLDESMQWLERHLAVSERVLPPGRAMRHVAVAELAVTCAMAGDEDRAWALLTPIADRLETSFPLARANSATLIIRDAIAPLVEARAGEPESAALLRWLAPAAE